jgi:hypothetical protein
MTFENVVLKGSAREHFTVSEDKIENRERLIKL